MRTHPKYLLLLLLGVALAFVSPFEKPKMGKRKKKGSAPAAVQVGGAWSSDRFLDEHMERACEWVKVAARADYVKRPTVKVSSTDEVAGFLREDLDTVFRTLGAAGDEQVAAMSRALASQLLAAYDPAKNVIHILPSNAVAAAKAAGNPALASADVLKLVLVRMGTVAMDRQLYVGWKTAVDAATNSDAVHAAGAVIEGHAQYITKRVADQWVLKEQFPAGAFSDLVTLLTTATPVDGLKAAAQAAASEEAKFAIIKGHAFMEAAARRRGGAEKVLNTPPTNRNPIFDPAKFFEARRKPLVSNVPAKVLSEFAGLVTGDGWNTATTTMDKDQAAKLLEPLPRMQTSAILAAFKSGTAWVSAKGEYETAITLIEMRGPGMAESFVAIRKAATEAAGGSVEEGAGRDSGLPGFAGSLDSRAIQWTNEGRYVLGIATTDADATREKQDDALEAAADVLAKAQKTRANRRRDRK